MPSREAEDYLEAIYNIIQEKGHARPKDVVKVMSVKAPSVTDMLKKLGGEGFVEHEKYGAVTLTPKGRRVARQVKSNHDLLVKFLGVLGLPEKIANKDACELEHDLDPRTVRRLLKFVEFATQGSGVRCMKEFRKHSGGRRK